MDIALSTCALLALSALGFGADVYLTQKGSLKGWRGLFRATGEMVGVGCATAIPLSKMSNRGWEFVIMAVVVVALVRLVMLKFPPSHET